MTDGGRKGDRWVTTRGNGSFRSFVVARRPALLRTAWLLTGNRDDAEDLVQTALMKAAKHWRRVVAAGDPEPYVRRILVTSHISGWRRAGRATLVPLGGEDGEQHPPDRPVDPGGGADDRVVLAAALARLTPKQRAVLVLRFYEDLSEGQAAQVMGVRLGTVKSQTRHALARLRDLAPELAAYAPADTTTQEVPR